MAEGFILNANDKRIISQVVREVLSQQGNPQAQNPSGIEFEDHQAPEVYIALPPQGGIPALTRVGTSDSPGIGDTPGSADCDIYTLDSSGNLQKVGTTSFAVKNLSKTIVSQDWVIVKRNKHGVWFCEEAAQATFKEGVLLGNLAAATNGTDNPSTQNLTVYAPALVGTGGWEATGETIVITNRMTQITTIPSGAWLGAILTHGEYRPVVSDCSATTIS